MTSNPPPQGPPQSGPATQATIAFNAQPVTSEYPLVNVVSRPSKLAALVVLTFASGALGGVTTSFFTEEPEPAPTSIVNEHISQTVEGGVDWSSTATTASDSVVTLNVSGSSSYSEGSGVIYDDEGTIITNHHVIAVAEGDRGVRVLLGTKAYEAEVVGSDPTTDIAVLKLKKLPAGGVRPITFADSNSVEVGDNVMALGSPLGLQGTATTGIVSAVKRPVVSSNNGTIADQELVITNAIQTSAPINPGNSGGALVDKDGRLIGVNSSIASVTETARGGRSGNIGIGFAIPSNQVKRITEEILEDGEVNHAFLGITTSNNVVATDSSNVVGTLGVQIRTVGDGTPADRAGLKVGDNIITYNGYPVTTKEALVAEVRESSPGDEVTLEVLSYRGDERTVTLKLASING